MPFFPRNQVFLRLSPKIIGVILGLIEKEWPNRPSGDR